jgi:hypothetical protein
VIANEGLPVEVACRVLDVSSAGYYAWRERPLSARAVRQAWLTDVIREVHAASYGGYGAKRVYAELTLGRGVEVGHNAVAMLMQRAGIAGRNGARTWRGAGGATSEDLVDRCPHGRLRQRRQHLQLRALRDPRHVDGHRRQPVALHRGNERLLRCVERALQDRLAFLRPTARAMDAA